MSDQVDKLRAALLAARQRTAAPAPPTTALAPAPPAVIERVPHDGADKCQITDAGLEQIRQDRANGLSLASIAKRLGMNRSTFARLRERDPRIDEALVVGHSGAEDELVDIIMKKARHAESDRDSLIAAMFLLKARHQYRDTGALDGAPSTVNVQVNNFETLTTEEMRKRVAELIQLRERLLNAPEENHQAQDAEIVEGE